MAAKNAVEIVASDCANLTLNEAQYISYNKYIILTECKPKLSSSNLKFDYILDIIQLVKMKIGLILL